MPNKRDGGSAFPRMDADTRNQGMTLRDYFAGQYLAGQLANPLIDPEAYADHAERAYAQADAMLEERGR